MVDYCVNTRFRSHNACRIQGPQAGRHDYGYRLCVKRCSAIIIPMLGGKNKHGFTIVELLIVIVVIGILAAITVVAFGTIQSRANNAKTVSAVASWGKALQLYKQETGDYPAFNSCLGKPTTYTSSHSGRCYATEANSTWVVNSSFLTAMSSVITNYPEPSDKDIHANVGGTQYRGAMYYIPSGLTSDAEIRVSLFGVTSTADCPTISGLLSAFASFGATSGRVCQYKLPQ